MPALHWTGKGVIASRAPSRNSNLDLFGEMKVRRFGLQHPQRDLHCLPIGMLNRHRVRGMSRPDEDLKRTINQWDSK